MYRFAALLLALLATPCLAQIPAPDCTVDADLAEGLKIEVHYLCRSTVPLVFESSGRIEPANGIVETRYRVDLTKRDADANELMIRGQGADAGALATLGMWLAQPRGLGGGYERLPVIDIRVRPAPGLVFSSGQIGRAHV